MVKDSGDDHYIANVTADGAVPLECQSAFGCLVLKMGEL